MANTSKPNYMVEDIGGPSNVATPDYGLLANAAKIKGESTARAIDFAGKAGVMIYEGYVDKVASDKAKAVTEGLNAPELGFQGPLAYQVETEQAQLKKDGALIKEMGGDVLPQALEDFNRRAKSVSEAAQFGVFNQAQAQARLATDMRELIAAHPGQADRIRKMYSFHTGRADWDYRPIEHALTAQAQENQAQKIRNELLQKDAVKIYDQGIGSKYGMKSSADIFMHIAQGSDEGVRMQSEMQSQQFIDHANVAMTKGSMNEYFNNAMLAAGATRVQTTQSIIQNLKISGIDVSNMSAPTEAQRPAIEEAYRDAKVAERNALEGAIKGLESRIASNPAMDQGQVHDTLERLKKQLSNTPLTSDLQSMFDELKTDATARNMAADTVLKAHQIRDLALRTTWSDKIIAGMKDPRTRAQLVADYPDNPYVKGLADEFAGRQAGFTQEMNSYHQLADGLFNAAAPWAHKAAVAEAQSRAAAGDKEAAKKLAAIIQIESGEGAKVLAAGQPTTDRPANSAIATAGNFATGSKEWGAIYKSVMSGTHEDVFRNNTANIPEFTKTLGERIERFLAPVDGLSYPSKIKGELATVLKNNPDISLIVKDGKLSINNLKGGVYANGGMHSIAALGQSIDQVNQMLDVYNKLGVDGAARASKLLADITAQPAPQNPVTNFLGRLTGDNLAGDKQATTNSFPKGVTIANPETKKLMEQKMKEMAAAGDYIGAAELQKALKEGKVR